MTHYSQTIRAEGTIAGAFRAAGAAAAAAFETLAADLAAGRHHYLSIARETADLEPARDVAERFRSQADDVVVLGTGGSALGAQALVQVSGLATPIAHLAGGPRLTFLDNLDGPTMARLLDGLDWRRTRFLIVSKSGGTAETLMQALAVIAAARAKGYSNLADLAAVITEPKDQPLARLAAEHGFQRLDHPVDIGGRFSVLSVVGLLPALIAGLDALAVRQGAQGVLSAALAAKGGAPCEGAAFSAAAAEAGLPVHVLFAYSDRLERFALWYRQLWAESLGKNGKGTLPVRAIGPVDQHSQLQYYLGGPRNAVYTLLTDGQEGSGPFVPRNVTSDPSLHYLTDRRIGDLVAAEARATLDTLAAHARPTRHIALPHVGEASLGALFMHYMIETILAAALIGVDAFDQPAVEEGKILAKRYLKEMG